MSILFDKFLTKVRQKDSVKSSDISSIITAVDAKTTPVDADAMPIIDSEASNVLKKVSWTNIKATLKSFFNIDHTENNNAAGRLWGGEITDAGSGKIDIAAGEGVIKLDPAGLEDIPASLHDGAGSETARVSWDAITDFPLAGVGYNLVYWDASEGEFAVQLKEDFYANFNFVTDFTIGRVYYDGSSVVVRLCGMNKWNFDRRVQMFGEEKFPIERATGLMISATGTRNIALTSGILWVELVNRFSIDAFNSSTTGTFTYWYRDGSGGWTTIATQTQINNTQYDDGDGTLGTLTANRYGVHWVYIVHNSTVHVVFGQDDYTLANANLTSPPVILPGLLSSYATLVGKIVIQKSAASFTSIQSPFTTTFTAGSVTNHNDLSGIQGGTTDEYYHLTSAQATVVGNTSGSNSGDQTLPVKATGAELDTGIDDDKFATAKAIKDSKNVPSVAPGTSGNVLMSDGINWTSADLPGGGDMLLASAQTVTGLKTFDKDKIAMKGTSTGATTLSTANASTTDYTATLPAATGTVLYENGSAASLTSFPTLNQNTTGTAAKATILETTRAIYGNNFDGSAALTQVIASTYGGTGNGFTKFSGPATAEKTFTLPDANATLARTDAGQTFTGVNTMTAPVFNTTISTPKIITASGALTLEPTAGSDLVTTLSGLGRLKQAGSEVVTGSASTVITGSIDPTASTSVTGVGTKFLTEIRIGDRITVSGETRTVTDIASDTALTVDTAFSNNENDTSVDRLSAISIFRKSNGTNAFVINDIGQVFIEGGYVEFGRKLSTDTIKLAIGQGRTGSGFSLIDIIGDATYTEYGIRIIRGNGGANTNSQFHHRGTGDMILWGEDAGAFAIKTNNTEHFRITSAGVIQAMSASNAMNKDIRVVNTYSVSDAGQLIAKFAGYSSTVREMGYISWSNDVGGSDNNSTVDIAVRNDFYNMRSVLKAGRNGSVLMQYPINYAVDAQASDTYVITLAPALTAYIEGQKIIFKANTANTGAATININELGAKTIVKRVNTTLANGDILAGMICDLIYNGTNFVLLNPVVN